MVSRKDFRRRIYDFLESLGATEAAFIEGKKHDRIVFTYQGHSLFIHCSSSPSCPFAHKHVIGDINRLVRSTK
jgi:hypothetical protein